ncbi:MAG: hypothetical protein WA190_10230 [Usitatibacter sp.]
MARPKVPTPISASFDVTTSKLSAANLLKLGERLGAPLSEEQSEQVATILCTHRDAAAVSEDKTPANVAEALRRAKQEKSLGTLLDPRSGLDEITFDSLAAVTGASWADIERVIDKRIAELRTLKKLHSAHQRILGLTAWLLGQVYRQHHKIKDLPPSSKQNRACRRFVCDALESARIPFPDPTRNPRRIDELIWSNALTVRNTSGARTKTVEIF